MVEVIPIDPHKDPRWLTFLTEHPKATIFHHPVWFQVLEEAYRYRPFCRAFVREGNIVWLLPLLEVRSVLTGNRGVCLPFSDVCQPLAQDDEVTSTLGATCHDLVSERRWKYLEIRDFLQHPHAIGSTRYKYHITPLERDSDKVFHTFKRTSVRQTIGKALRNGITVERRRDPEAMEELFHLMGFTRRKHGVAPQPASFFRAVYKHIIAQNHGFLYLSRYQNKTIAAGVFLLFKKGIFFKYAAADEELLHLRPYHPLVWEAIKWGCENGYEFFDFGRSDPANEGLVEYKRGWGAQESDIQYVRFGTGEGKSSGTLVRVQERFAPVMRKLPVLIVELIGRVLYRHMG
jgi:CelD/BcsL family acetyltransferase involved in cellulose biosynthesis